MTAREGLENAEYLILGELDGSPRQLKKLGWIEAPSRRVVTEILGPGLVSLAERGLIEVRRFELWPAPWETGTPVLSDELRQASGRVDEWSGDAARGGLAAHIAEAGIPYL